MRNINKDKDVMLKWKKWAFLAIVALVPILSGCEGCDKKKYAPPPAPSAPSNLTAAVVSSTQINLNWKDNSTNEKGFYVYRRITGDYSRVAVLAANATSYSTTGLTPETTYWYKATAYNDGGESGSSNEVSIVMPAGPGPGPEPEPEPEPEPVLQAPSNLWAIVGYLYVQLHWTDNSNDEDGFRVYCDMGKGQYQEIACRLPNQCWYEHDYLQPMTEYKYYVEVYRGEEKARSEEASYTTGCPVIILRDWISDPASGPKCLCLDLKNFAERRCQVEVTAYFYESYDTQETEILKEIFPINALAEEHFEMEIGFSFTDYDVEVTDVEIEY